MAYFNKDYTEKTCNPIDEDNLMEYVLIPDDEEESSLNEMDTFGKADVIVASILAAPFVILTGVAIKKIADNVMITKALKKYPEKNFDCPSIKSFKRKIYTIKPYTDEPGKEMKGYKRFKADKGLAKHRFNKCVCYFDDSGNMQMYYCYRYIRHYGVGVTTGGDAAVVSKAERKIAARIVNGSLRKHYGYFYTSFLKEQKLCNKESVKWAKGVVKDDDE